MHSSDDSSNQEWGNAKVSSGYQGTDILIRMSNLVGKLHNTEFQFHQDEENQNERYVQNSLFGNTKSHNFLNRTANAKIGSPRCYM